MNAREAIIKTVALEAECKHLRLLLKQESEKYTTSCAAMMQRVNAAIEGEREKMTNMQRHFEKEQERLIDKSHKDAFIQRATHMEALGDIKRQLDLKYNEKLNENKAAFDAAMQDLEQERERIKRDEQTRMSQMNEEREIIKQALTEMRERMKREEKEQVMQFLNKMELEREKVQHQAENERTIMMEQMHKEIAEHRKLNEDNIKEMNRSFVANWDEKRKRHEIAMQEEEDKMRNREEKWIAQRKDEQEKMRQAEEERIAQRKEEARMEEERVAQMKEEQEKMRQAEEERVAQRKEEQEKMRQREEELIEMMKEEQGKMRQAEEERIALMKEEMEKMRQREEERIALMQEEQEKRIAQINEEQEQMRQKMKQEEHENHVKFLAYMESDRNEQNLKEVLETKIKQLDIAMQNINNERNQMHVKEGERIALMKEEREQMRQTENGRIARMKEEMRKREEEQTTHMKNEQDKMCKREEERIVQMKNEHIKICQKIKQEEDERRHQFLKHMESERKKMQSQLENERTQACKEAELQRQKIKQEEEEHRLHFLNYMESERKKMKSQLENDRIQSCKEAEFQRQKIKQEEEESRIKFLTYMETERKKWYNEAESQRQCNLNVLNQLESQYNAERKERELVFESEMQKLNQERAQLNHQLNEERERNARDEVEREKVRMLQITLENERKEVAEQAEALLKSNDAALASSRQELAEERERNLISFDAAMQKLVQERQKLKKLEREHINSKFNEERERTGRNELEREKINILQLQFENEHIKIVEQAKNEVDAQRKFNAKVLAEKTREIEFELNKQIRILNEERDQIKRNEMERKQTEKERAAWFEIAQQDESVKREHIRNELRQHMNEQLKSKMNELNQEKENMKTRLIEERAKLKEELALENFEHEQQMNNEKQQLVIETQQLNNEISYLNKQFIEVKETNQSYQSKINELNEQLMHSLSELKEQFYSDVKKELHDTVDSNTQHMRLILGLDFKGKRVMVYSHYSEHENVESYNVLSLECIEHYFDYIIILTNCPNKWNIHSPNYNKYYLLNYNMKSDFRNYGVFIMQSAKTIANASRLCLINDSFLIVDVNAYGLCMKHFFNNEMITYDFGGLTSSHEGTFHLQSYLMCFNGPTIPHVLTYFETNGLPANHGHAISQYELGITKYLTDKRFSPYAVVSNDDMRIPLNTTCSKWEKVFEKTGIIKRQHFLKQYAYSAMTDDDIARVATNHFYNKHFIHFLNYHGINQKFM